MKSILHIKAKNNKIVAKYSVKNNMFDVGVSRYYYSVYLVILQYIRDNTTKKEYEGMKTHYERFDKLRNITGDHRINGVINNLNKMRKSRNISEYSSNKIIRDLNSFNFRFFNIYKKVLSTLKDLEVCDV